MVQESYQLAMVITATYMYAQLHYLVAASHLLRQENKWINEWIRLACKHIVWLLVQSYCQRQLNMEVKI